VKDLPLHTAAVAVEKSSKMEVKRPKSLKIQTYMLGRVTMKEESGEVQPAGDQAIANGILRQRWTRIRDGDIPWCDVI
jgi:hypothetical protein